MTPDETASWDGTAVHYGPGVAQPPANDDALDELWRTYYGAVFNPARINLRATKREMPVRHWLTLPEAQDIATLLREAPARVEAMIRRGQGQRSAAAMQARDTLRYVNTRPEGSEVRGFYFVAAANFILAETVRLQFDEAPIPPGDVATQRQALDARAAYLLEAQRLYFDTMRWSEAHWTAAAGYQIGSLYDRFFQSILAAPVPPASETLTGAELADYEQTYRESLAQYIEPLLRHSIRYWELTLQMIERTGDPARVLDEVDRPGSSQVPGGADIVGSLP